MIITFLSDAHESLTMFGDVAEQLIKYMGYDVKAGIIKSENISQALTELKNALAQNPPAVTPASTDDWDNQENEKPISLAHRAFPLIEMLEDSSKENCDVKWKSSN